MDSVDNGESSSKTETVENPVKKTDVDKAWLAKLSAKLRHENPTEHGVPEQTALQQILTKMDAQFLEIKETLYVRVYSGLGTESIVPPRLRSPRTFGTHICAWC